MTRGEPVWLTVLDALVLHETLLRAHGGAPGIRDAGLLQSALARPQHRFQYGKRDLHVLATAYASGLTRNHPFVDGNKRTAFMAAFVFLGVNGQDLHAEEGEVVRAVLGLTEKSLSEDAFAGWLRANCRPHRKVRPTRAKAKKKSPPKRRSADDK